MHRLRSDGIAWQAVEGEMVCLDLRTSTYLAINESGALLWPMLVDGTDEANLTETVASAFGLSTEEARRDVQAFVKDLESRDLLEAE